MRSPGGEETVTQLVFHHLCEVAEVKEPFDLVYIVTRAYDARWHSELIESVLKPDGLAVGLQNGMTLDDMADVLGPERTFARRIASELGVDLSAVRGSGPAGRIVKRDVEDALPVGDTVGGTPP
jgi:ketopantoate reductase